MRQTRPPVPARKHNAHLSVQLPVTLSDTRTNTQHSAHRPKLGKQISATSGAEKRLQTLLKQSMAIVYWIMAGTPSQLTEQSQTFTCFIVALLLQITLKCLKLIMGILLLITRQVPSDRSLSSPKSTVSDQSEICCMQRCDV